MRAQLRPLCALVLQPACKQWELNVRAPVGTSSNAAARAGSASRRTAADGRAAAAHRALLPRTATRNSWRASLLAPNSSAATRAAESMAATVSRRAGTRQAERRLDARATHRPNGFVSLTQCSSPSSSHIPVRARDDRSAVVTSARDICVVWARLCARLAVRYSSGVQRRRSTECKTCAHNALGDAGLSAVRSAGP